MCAVLSKSVYANKPVVIFFDPDANLANAVRIKGSLQTYLKTITPDALFQPVTKQKVFEKILERKQPNYVIVSSYYYKNNKDRLGLNPLLIPLKQGKMTYKKILLISNNIVKNGNEKINLLSIATTSARDFILSLKLEKSGLNIKDATVIPVTKDIDALLALSYGQVSSALVVPDSYVYLEDVNPESVKNMRIVFKSHETVNPLLCSFSKNNNKELTNKIEKAFINIMSDENGKTFMELLKYNKWIKPPEKLLE